MLPALGVRSPLLTVAVAAGFLLVLLFGFLAWHSPPSVQLPYYGSSSYQHPTSYKDILNVLYADLKPAPDQPSIDDGDGGKLELSARPRYRKGLGKEVLILDLDTRPLGSTEDYRNGQYNWRKINHVSGGVFNHHTYSVIHGYDYKFVQAPNFEDRHPTWIKPSALANELKKYKFIVFLDADATFRFLHLPIEWMLNYWDIQPHHSITMALDPWDPKEPQYNSDRFNRTYTNTGFMVVQNNKYTQEILRAWHECPEDTRYANCSEWKKPKFHEQSAFGEFVRYDYEKYIKELPCAEANGFPGVTVSNCQGRFIRHYWFDKSLVKRDFADNIMQALSLPIQRVFSENIGNIVVQTKENKIG
ncbi:hypothetical protein M011DRAFT_479522 [Sporormia fimetaria CBS 119925]|uniref:Nucleotide-diphospho-sugar transferase domain-containing protein n=1 Tax=Sporormia fimetaria CBS 119925 TaxID=1340428 RepID=A0A6A6V2G6_9PLEO|nr:hypothetical protein M011DRAFT_479522 [Sporormia fimetaria CBS 119925]